jgi:aryl-alcohol dehydrogenase-like predicted oxidoreductase
LDLKKAFDSAYSKGFTLWDTAAVYGMGNAEKILGEFTKDKDFILSDKFSPSNKFSEKAIDKTLAESMARLNEKKPDIYWLHQPKCIEQNLEYLCVLAKEEKIGAIGVSNFNLEQLELAEKILNKHNMHVAGVQNHYSLIFREYENTGVIEWCKSHNIPFFAYMMLEQGVLSGKYSAKKPFPMLSRRGMAFPKAKLQRLEPLFSELKKLGEKYKISTASVPLVWGMSKGVVPLVGVTSDEQTTELAKIADICLTDKEIETLESVSASTGISVKASWE